jgi:hypothetical protein
VRGQLLLSLSPACAASAADRHLGVSHRFSLHH